MIRTQLTYTSDVWGRSETLLARFPKKHLPPFLSLRCTLDKVLILQQKN